MGNTPPRTAVETADRVTRAVASAVETVRAALTDAHRIRHLRAFVELWPGSALDRAAEVDARVADGARLPLAGVPLAVKAAEGTASHQARRLIAAGAVPIGATSVPAPGTRWKTWGHTDGGPTLNPWRADRVPGGSSAGSAVAVATGVVPLATASDGAGSTRIPAAWCGVLGYKPTTGLLPARDRAGLTVGGPIARTVSDLELYRSTVLGGASAAAPAHVRVAWSPTLGFNRPDPEVVAVAERALRRWARTCGVTLSEPRLALTDPAESWLSRREQNSPGSQTDVGVDNLSALAELFAAADLLATPATPNPPHPHSGPGEVMSVGFTWLFNLTGHPALSLPAGLTPDGLPVGLHLVARHHEDALLLAAARSAEQALPSLPENPLGGGVRASER
ncbi:amidase [Nocardiopsis exhalans]|uniref:Amidase n=1 Tax=Nocardiopsis exhalans TaxID=163604 RepID=A0ABY5D9F2_9ACTN|nr:amidase [Nocardiopsis exhalans]USY20550.1 amidase [Nocardiopsis exhalans]